MRQEDLEAAENQWELGRSLPMTERTAEPIGWPSWTAFVSERYLYY